MGSEYTRNDAANNIADGNVISAADLDGEFDKLVTAFAAGTGHSHDGTAGEGGYVTKLLGTSLTIGDGTAGTDITVTFDGESSDGVLTWMEDEDYFTFSDDILMSSTEKIQFGDAATFIQQSSDGVLRIDGEATINLNATAAISLVSDAITLGENGNTDVVLTFNATSADGVLTWMEDEDYFTFSDDILMSGTEKIQFGDTASFIQQSSDGVLRIDGEATINLNATAGITLVSDSITFGENGDTDVVLAFSANSADGELKWMEDEDYFEFSDDILVASTEKIQFRDTALAIHSSTDGQLDIDADTELEITAPIVDIDASTRVDISVDLTVGNDLTLGSDGAILNFGTNSDIVLTHVADTGLNLSSVTAGDLLVLTSTEGGASAGPNLVLNRDSGSPANDDYAGSIIFKADDDGNNSTTIASITTRMIDVGASSEDSDVVFSNIVNSTVTAQLTLSSTGVTANTDLIITDDLTVGDDLTLNSDSSVINMGAGNDATFTHDGTTGLTIAANPIIIDSGGNLELDSHTGIWIFEDAGSEVLRFTEGNSGDVTIKLVTNAKDLIFTDNGDATNMKILDAAAGINVPGEVQTTKIAYTDGDDAMTVADGGKVSFSAAAVGKQQDTSAGSSLTPNFNEHSHFWIDANANFTINNPSDTENKGQSGLFIFTHNGGARTCSIGTEYMIAGGGTSITLSTSGAGVVDIFPYYVYDTNKIILGAPTLDVKA